MEKDEAFYKKFSELIEASVKLKGGELIVKVVGTNDSDTVKQLLSAWYYQHAVKKFEELISKLIPNQNWQYEE